MDHPFRDDSEAETAGENLPANPPPGWPAVPYRGAAYQTPYPGTPARSYYGGQYPGPDPRPQAPRQQRKGFLGWLTGVLLAIWAYAKYALAFGLKFGALKTALTLILSFGAYAWLGGPTFAAALVIMILLHELGHVFEIRRQGMQATAPLFIPFLGAAIFQRSHPTDALHQAMIGIAGPIAGTLAASASMVIYLSTGVTFFLYAAFIGFFLNLFNLIPFGMLDGGWVLSAASKWAQVAGIVLLVGLVLVERTFSPVILLVVLLGIPTMLQRFRNDRLPYYQSVPSGARWAMAGAWFVLVVYLGFMLMQVNSLAGLPSQ